MHALHLWTRVIANRFSAMLGLDRNFGIRETTQMQWVKTRNQIFTTYKVETVLPKLADNTYCGWGKTLFLEAIAKRIVYELEVKMGAIPDRRSVEGMILSTIPMSPRMREFLVVYGLPFLAVVFDFLDRNPKHQTILVDLRYDSRSQKSRSKFSFWVITLKTPFPGMFVDQPYGLKDTKQCESGLAINARTERNPKPRFLPLYK